MSQLTLGSTYLVKEFFLTEPLHFGEKHSHELVVRFESSLHTLFLCFFVDSRPSNRNIGQLDLETITMGKKLYYETKYAKVILFPAIIFMQIPLTNHYTRKWAKSRYREIYDPPGMLDFFRVEDTNDNEPLTYVASDIFFYKQTDKEGFVSGYCKLVSSSNEQTLTVLGNPDTPTVLSHFIIIMAVAFVGMFGTGLVFLNTMIPKDNPPDPPPSANWRIGGGVILYIFLIAGIVLSSIRSTILIGVCLLTFFIFSIFSNVIVYKIHDDKYEPFLSKWTGFSFGI